MKWRKTKKYLKQENLWIQGTNPENYDSLLEQKNNSYYNNSEKVLNSLFEINYFKNKHLMGNSFKYEDPDIAKIKNKTEVYAETNKILEMPIIVTTINNMSIISPNLEERINIYRNINDYFEKNALSLQVKLYN